MLIPVTGQSTLSPLPQGAKAETESKTLPAI